MDDESHSEELEAGGPAGTVTVNFFTNVVCATDWGGWSWFADGVTEGHAREHLRQRLEHLDPFFGGPDYGRFGGPSDDEELDPRIPEATRRRITAYLEGIDERWRRDAPGPS